MHMITPIAAVLALWGFEQSNDTTRASSTTVTASTRSMISVRRDDEPMIEGSGRLIRQTRAVEDFDTIELSGAANLDVAIGPQLSLEVEADDNLIDLQTTEIVDGKLVIGTAGSFRTRTVPRVRITVPRLAGVETSGSGNAHIAGISGGRLSLAGRGSGDFVVEGRSDAVDADMYGSGRLDLERLAAPDLSVSIFGSGGARVRVTRALHATVYGTGSIDYRGDAERIGVQSQVFGTGRIRHLGS